MPHPTLMYQCNTGGGMALKRTFHVRKDSRSIMVVWVISCPGNIPQVTAFRPSSGTLVLHSPCTRMSLQKWGYVGGYAHLQIRTKIVHPASPICRDLPLNPLQHLFFHKEFYETFLENIPAHWTPPENFIRRWHPVHCGLRANGPPPALCQLLQVWQNS
jgi:hypothetical protein